METDNITIAQQIDEPLGLYVHWPFCASKCPYCDFNSHVTDQVDHPAWSRSLITELEHFGSFLQGRPLGSIFFGGGTPSLMEPDTAAAVIDAAQKLTRFNNDIEITLEANPTSVEAGKLNAFRAAGITRLSMGVQALNDADLNFLGRTHSAAEARKAIAVARACFDNVSFDLITARPDQNPADWLAEIDEAVALGVDHLSIYQLTIEPTTPFHALHARGAFTLPVEDDAAALYEATRERLSALGLPTYEVSNHARPGHECRHNLNYWQYGDYVGIGPGAHGRLSERVSGSGDTDDRLIKRATRTHRAPKIWLERVARDGHALVDDEPVERDAMLTEATMMGLRTVGGLSRDRWRALFGVEPEALFSTERIGDLVEAGYLELDTGGMRATEEGRLRLDAVTGHLLTDPA
jgi:oxygen-independent coproporphyrinogen-3 oxidase